MRYHYKCAGPEDSRCTLDSLPDSFYAGELDIEIALDSRLIDVNENGGIDYNSPLVWVVVHGMSESPEVKCPVCGSNASRVIRGASATYIRGNGYLDKRGCQRDMNLFKLTQEDPYGYMRQPGESDDLANRLRRGGKFNPKTKHYLT